MAIIQSNAAKGSEAIPYPSEAGNPVAKRYAMAVPITVNNGDILELAPIPPNCSIVDLILDSDALGAAFVADVGIMSGDWGSKDGARTCGAEFFSASTTGAAGGVARPTLASAYKVAPSDKERSIGVKVTTKSSAPAPGSIGLTVFCATT